MIETETYYKIRLTEDQARQLYNLLQMEKDRFPELRELYRELGQLHDNYN
jgi:hypothetical protein